MKNKNVVILGASRKPQRYAHQAQLLLIEHGYVVFPVSRKSELIAGKQSVSNLTDIKKPIDTVTIYVRPELLETMLDALIELRPRRVIFNPGTESESLASRLQQHEIETTEACTLVLLNTGQFEDAL